MSVAPKNKLADSSEQAEKSAAKPAAAKPEPGKEKKAPKPTAAKPAEMSGELIEFIQAIDEYKRLQQRPFPSWGEVLEILKDLGYARD